jgi:hypothetical protein
MTPHSSFLRKKGVTFLRRCVFSMQKKDYNQQHLLHPVEGNCLL